MLRSLSFSTLNVSASPHVGSARAMDRLYSLISLLSLAVLLALEYSSSMSDVSVLYSRMVDGASDAERYESLARETDLCLAGDSSLCSLSYGADLSLADSALIGLLAPL